MVFSHQDANTNFSVQMFFVIVICILTAITIVYGIKKPMNTGKTIGVSLGLFIAYGLVLFGSWELYKYWKKRKYHESSK